MNLEITKNEQYKNIWKVSINGTRVGSILRKGDWYETKLKIWSGACRTTERIQSFEEAKKIFEAQLKELVEFLSSSYTDEDIMEVIEKRLAEIPIKNGK